MTPLNGDIARREFLAEVSGKSKFGIGQSQQEPTLEFIQDTFKKIAEGTGTVKVGEHTVNVESLKDKELRALCRLSKKFFNTQKDLHLKGEFLADIQSVRNQHHSFRTRLLLDPLKSQIYRNESVDPKLGAPREKLQTELLTKMKNLDQEMADLKKRNLIFRIATVLGVGGGLGGVIGAGLVLGGTIGMLAIGTLALIAMPFIGIDLYRRDAVRTNTFIDKENEKEACMWAFELLQDPVKFDAFCAEKGVEDPDNVTFEGLLDAYNRDSVVVEDRRSL